jgi:hypothetical protein
MSRNPFSMMTSATLIILAGSGCDSEESRQNKPLPLLETSSFTYKGYSPPTDEVVLEPGDSTEWVRASGQGFDWCLGNTRENTFGPATVNGYSPETAGRSLRFAWQTAFAPDRVRCPVSPLISTLRRPSWLFFSAIQRT